MTIPAIFRRIAQSEYDVAHDFYVRKSSRTAARFARAIDDVLDEIVANPQRFPIADLDIREAPVSGFPYCVYYVIEPNRLDILSVFHTAAIRRSGRAAANEFRSMHYRVFGRSPASPSPAALAEHLHAVGLAVEPHFRGDDLGWTGGELVPPGGTTPVLLERYLTDEDDLRDTLNTFAAELETMTYSPNAVTLMEHVINTAQLVTLRKPTGHADESRVGATVVAAVRFLAAGTGGVYQIDGQGWFAADGTLLVPER